MRLRVQCLPHGRFEGTLLYEWHSARYRRLRQLEPPWAYITSWGHRIEPPDGMLTDLGTIPRFIWWLLPRDEYAPGYVIHDYLCDSGILPRAVADYVLQEAIATLGGPTWKQWLIYLAVRVHSLIRGVLDIPSR